MKLMNVRFSLFPLIALLFALVLAGCETVPFGAPPSDAPSVGEAEKAEAAGDYIVAAREYLKLAAAEEPPLKQTYELRAVDMLIVAGQSQEARDQLRNINVQALEPSFSARKRILEARLFSLEGAHEKAIRQLDEAARARNLDPSLLAEIHYARAQAELALNNPIGAVRNLVLRESLIVSKEQISDNQLQIWKTLNAMPRAQLGGARQLTGDPLLGGWLDLALLSADNAGNDDRLRDALKA
jgi:outer membrane PBP1 activator LpoA protein